MLAAILVVAGALAAPGTHFNPLDARDDVRAGGARGDDAPGDDDETVVTALKRPRPRKDVPADVVIVPRAEIERAAAVTSDNLLRTVPSAATFRRSSSLVADPSSQGLNLRGLGPSGVSRALVLLDGVPLNDPFGGWIYWRSVSLLGLDRVEIVPSGSSSLYGSAALGGVVQMFSRPAAPSAFDLDVDVGSSSTLHGALRGADVVALGPLGTASAVVESEGLGTGGWPVVSGAMRGPIDGAAPILHGSLAGAVAWQRDDVEVTVRARGFREEQNGGTTFTTAGAEMGLGSASLRWHGALGAVEANAFARAQTFTQTRARVADGRVDEALTAAQRVPADEQGAALAWTSPPAALGGAHAFTLGADARRVTGTSFERLSPAVRNDDSIVARAAGGEQRFAGVYAQHLWSPAPPLDVTASLRGDVWQNVAGERTAVTAAGVHRRSHFDNREGVELSPRAGALLRVVDGLRLRGSVYRAFRVPTLNELYRPFQVGTVVTAANEDLSPERLWGGEAGFELSSSLGLGLRGVAFWNEVESPVANVTLAEPVDGAQRRRENLGGATVRGLELGADWRFARAWSALASWALVDARVTEGPAALIGKRLAQDPVHRATAALAFTDARLFTAQVQVRVIGEQFEDDLNELAMEPVALVDASLSRQLAHGFEVFAAVENVLNTEYVVGRAGVDTIGQPFFARAGIRYRTPARR